MIKLKKTGAALAICASALIAVASLSGCGDTATQGGGAVEVQSQADESEATRRPVQSARPSAAENDEAESRRSAEPADSESETGSGAAAVNSENSMEAASTLSEARSFLDAGMYDDAEEMLSYVNTDELGAEEMDEYNAIRAELDSAAANAGSDAADELTAEEAISIVENNYGVQINGDPGGLTAQSGEDGSSYYELSVEVPNENARIIVRVHMDGSVTEVSRQPIAVG